MPKITLSEQETNYIVMFHILSSLKELAICLKTIDERITKIE